MPFWQALLICAGGVALSIALPILRKLLPQPHMAEGAGGSLAWQIIKPYVVVAAFSFAVALLVMAIAYSQDTELENWWQALLTGYVSDSTLQKFTTQ